MLEIMDKKELKYLETFYNHYLESLDYSEYKKVFTKYFSLGALSSNMNDKFRLISLISLLVHNNKLKNPNVTCYQVLKKILKNNTEEHKLKILCI